MNSVQKLLTVIIPSYNVEKYLPKTVSSLLQEEILNMIEVLIINDGSKDGTADIGKTFENKYPDTVKLINKSNGGHGSTINKGIELAKGKYFKVVDGDDWVDTNIFIAYVKALKTCSSDLILSPFIKVNINSEIKEKIDFRELKANKEYQLSSIIPVLKNSYSMHNVVFKTSILKNITKIDEHCFYVDQEFILYPLQKVQTVYYLNYPFYQYRVGDNEQSVSSVNLQKNRKMHEKVIFSLIIENSKQKEKNSQVEFTNYRIQCLCARQIDIYFSMNKNKQNKQELLKFLNKIKQVDLFVYKNIPGKKAFFMRMIGPIAYNFIYFIKRLR